MVLNLVHLKTSSVSPQGDKHKKPKESAVNTPQNEQKATLLLRE